MELAKVLGMATNKNIGSTFDNFLAEQGILEKCEKEALNQIEKNLKKHPGIVEQFMSGPSLEGLYIEREKEYPILSENTRK